MTVLEQLDQMARGGSIVLLALWAWILIRDHRQQFAARLAVVMIIAIICFLVVTSQPYERPTISGFVLALCGSSTPGIFWLFAKAWFNDEQRLRRGDLILVLLATVNNVVMQVSYPEGGILNLISGAIFRVSMLSFAAAGVWEAWRGRDGDLIESRRRLRPRLVVAVGAYVVLIALTEIAVHNLGMPYWLIGIVTSGIVVITFLFCAAMFGMRQADLFGPVSGARTATVKPAIDASLAEKLRNHMQRELVWRDEGLTIAALAAQLGEQEYRLRRVINGQLGHRNFAAFLNGYRIAEVKAALTDPSQRDVPIITIALDAGFGSLGPFNRAFREAEGMTPSEFRARALTDSEIG